MVVVVVEVVVLVVDDDKGGEVRPSKVVQQLVCFGLAGRERVV